jgi:hypothetical protein
MNAKDNSPIVGFYATVADRSIGSVGYYPVVDGDVEAAQRAASGAQDVWGRVVLPFEQ